MESNYRQLPPNPRESANILSILFFGWTLPLFKKGYGSILKLDDLFQPLICDKSETLGDRLESNWNKRTSKSMRCTLLVVIIDTFWKDYLLLAILCFFNEIVLRLNQQILLGKLLLYFRTVATITYEKAFINAIGIVLLNGLYLLINNHIMFLSFHYGMKIRIAVCSLIYRKTLRISQMALSETSAGKVANLLSNDVNRFEQASLFLNSLWVSPLVTIVIGTLLWHEIGVAGIVGIAVVLTIVPILSYAAKLTVKFRLKTATKTDERVRFMDEIISGVLVIKMYAWEKPFSILIDYARKLELGAIRNTSYIRGFHMTFLLFTTRMALFCTMVTIVLIYGPEQITASKIFVITSYFTMIALLMSQRFTRGVTECAEVFVALKRLEAFLYLDEKKTLSHRNELSNEYECACLSGIDNEAMESGDDIQLSEKSTSSITKLKEDVASESLNLTTNPLISMENVRARWKMLVKDESIDSAKKLSAQNGETNHLNGKTKSSTVVHDVNNRNGDTQYEICKENPLTIQQTPTLDCLNIEIARGQLIGIIGEVGAGKSSLLQALLEELPLESGSIDINGTISYANQEAWLFASSVRRNILFGQEYIPERYNEVVQSCALTRDFKQFENGDQTIVGERGASLSGGQKARINLARACYRNADIYLLDDPLSAVDSHVGTHIFNKCLGPNGILAKRNATRILVTHQTHFLKEADWIVILKNGEIETQGTPSDLDRNGFNFAQLDEVAEKTISRTSSVSSTSTVSSGEIDGKAQTENANNNNYGGFALEASSKGTVKGSLTLNYLRAGENWAILLILLFFFLFVQFLASVTDYWVSVWTKQEETRTLQKYKNAIEIPANPTNNTVNHLDNGSSSFMLTTWTCITVQGIFVAALFTFGIARSTGFYWTCSRISRNLHNAMFSGIISTAMRFYDMNPAGRILNRFAKDLGTVDEQLPKSMFDALQNVLSMLGLITVTAVVNPYFVIPIVFLGLFLFLQKIYLKTSKNVRRLEEVTKSQAFTHLATTLNGLSTVRAYNVETILKGQFDDHQDIHSACFYMSIASKTAFGLSLDVICFMFVSFIIFYYTLIDTRASGEKVGLAITQALGLTGVVQWGIRSCVEVSNQMTAVERVLEYRNLESENQPKKPQEVDEKWPSKGYIEFREVFYRYTEKAPPVLHNISFVIKPTEKIGIVGRTGAGKSSLIGSIFRLACVEGEILIDGIDTANIPLNILRKQIAIIPQDPVLFSGTLRRNLDPFEEYSDDDIWNALESVELKNVVAQSMGLHSKVLPRGVNYSVGQRQLLCLARAVLRKNRILLMDEATANVDPQTDSLIQQTIRNKFTECTVLTVAHRLHTIIDSDRVIVMNFGCIQEFDKPHSLLQNENGIFYDLVKAIGDQEFNRLAQIASEKFHYQ